MMPKKIRSGTPNTMIQTVFLTASQKFGSWPQPPTPNM